MQPVLFIGHLYLDLGRSVSTVHFPRFLKSAPQYITFRSGPRNRESISCKVKRVPPHHNDQTASGAHTHSPIKWRRPFGPGGKSPPGLNLIVQLNLSAEVTLQRVGSSATLTVPKITHVQRRAVTSDSRRMALSEGQNQIRKSSVSVGCLRAEI